MTYGSPFRTRFLVPFFLLAPLVAACGDSGTASSGTGGGGTGGGSGECPDNLAPAKNSEFCTATPGNLDCANVSPAAKNQVCGVSLTDAPGELARSTNVDEYAGSGPPDVACFEPANYPAAPGASEAVTAKGFARIFSSGCNSHDLKITFYKVVRDGSANDGALGEQVGTTVTTDADCTNVGDMSTADNCDTRWECPYEYPNVPTETELAIKTEGDPTWAPLIQYNIFIKASEVSAGQWDHDVRALAAPDYTVIPQTALGSPITPGNGAVAGEVHDCGDVRLTNAVANIDAAHLITTYFTSNEDSPLPDVGAKGTSVLGLYAALDVPAGPVTVAAGGMLNGEFVTLGQHRVFVYPDTVTSVTFKGLQPYQLPSQ
jgi:hypothetical protein